MRSAISAAAIAYWKSQSRHFTSTSKWGKLSLGAVKCPQPWEKLKIGVIGAPLNHGQVSLKKLLFKILKSKKIRQSLFTFLVFHDFNLTSFFFMLEKIQKAILVPMLSRG